MKKNKLLAVLLALAMTLSLLPTAALADEADAYTALKSAIEAATTDGKETTVTLQGDITEMTTGQILTISEGKNIVLNMADHSITVANDFVGRPIVNNGTLTVTGNGTISSEASKFGGYGAIRNDGGTLTIENGTFAGSVYGDGSAIRNAGTCTINKGDFTGTAAVYNAPGANLTINNGNFHTTSCNQTKDEDGKSYWAYCINSHGNLTFKNGTVTGVQGALAIGGGTGVVYDGTFKTVICEHDDAGTPAHYAIYVAGETGGATATIYGGTYTAASKAAIMVGNDNTGGDGGINAAASVTILGGTFTSKEGVNVMQTGPSTGTPSIQGGTFSNNGVSRQNATGTTITDYVPSSTHAVSEADGTFTVAARDASNSEAKIGETYYDTLAHAIAAADGETVTLLGDVTLTEQIVVTSGKTFELDLNGKTISSGDTFEDSGDKTTDFMFVVEGNLTIKDSASGGTIYMSKTNYPRTLRVNNGGTVTVESGMVTGSYAGAYIYAGGTMNVSGGNVYGEEYGIVILGNDGTNVPVLNVSSGNVSAAGSAEAAISGNGSSGLGNTKINITGGTVSKGGTSGYAIYHPQAGDLNISGNASISGPGGICVKAGNCDVALSGSAVITATGTAQLVGDEITKEIEGNTYTWVHNSNGAATSGYAVVIENNKSYAGASKVNIAGGTITGEVSIYNDYGEESDCGLIPADKQGSITITGGTFSSDPGGYVASGSHKVSFNYNNGDQTTYVVVANNEAVPQPADPTRSGYTFVGWKLNSSNYEFSTPVTGDITLIAQWTAIPSTPSGGGSSTTTPSQPTTSTETKPDGSTTTTETKPDGTVTESNTSAPTTDASGNTSQTTTETSTGKDGVTESKTETVTKPDGSASSTTESTTTKPDGTKTESTTETTVNKDGSTASTTTATTTNKDGTVTESKTEATTSTVTNKDGSTTETKQETTTTSTGSKTESTTVTTVNKDGSTTATTTATTTDKAGTVTESKTESTTNKNGTTTEKTTTTETKANGTVTESKTETTINKDGSSKATTTATVTKADGTKVESKTEATTSLSTNKTTGTVTETKKETTTTSTGVKSEGTTVTQIRKDGTVTSTETVKASDSTGTTATKTITLDAKGEVTTTAEVSVSSKAVTEAAKTGVAVTIPVEVTATKSASTAPTVSVSVPKTTESVKVELPVQNVTPGTVAVIVNADGTEKIVSTSMVTENGVALKLDGSATVKLVDNAKSFTDVPETNVFYNEISSLSARNIMIGVSNEKFDLHNSVTLDQVANVAGRITGAVDVKDFNAGVAWGKDGGLKTGNVSATRGDVLKALYIAAGSPAVEDTSILTRFKDASSIPADLAAIAAWAAQNGILKGNMDGTAGLSNNVTRGQACALAGRTMGTLA